MRSNNKSTTNPQKENEIYYIFIPECAYKDSRGKLDDITFKILRSREHRIFSESFFQLSYEFSKDKANKFNEKVKSREKVINEHLLTYFEKFYPETAVERLPPYVKVEINDKYSELSLAGGQFIQLDKPEQFVISIFPSTNFEHFNRRYTNRILSKASAEINRIHSLSTDSDENTNLLSNPPYASTSKVTTKSKKKSFSLFKNSYEKLHKQNNEKMNAVGSTHSDKPYDNGAGVGFNLSVNSVDQDYNKKTKEAEIGTSGSMSDYSPQNNDEESGYSSNSDIDTSDGIDHPIHDHNNTAKKLIPANYLFYYESIHWLNQNELIKKLLLLPSTKHELNLWSGRHLLNYSLRANAFPLNKKAKFAARINQLFSGTNDFLNGIWPATFLFLLFHDAWKYHIEEIEPYGTQGWEWWTGLAEHPDAWTSYWGDDNPHHYLSFWAWPIAATGCLLITMTNRLLKGRQFAHPLKEETINSLSASLHSKTVHFLNDSLNFLSYSTFQTHFERAIYAIKWDKHLSHIDRKILLEGIIYVAKNHTSITQLQAIAALGDIARTYNQASAKLLKSGTEQQPLDPSSITQSADSPTTSENYDDLETTTLTALEQLTHFKGNKPLAEALTAFYAQQVLWKQGYKIDRTMQAFLFITILVLLGGAKWFSKIRLAMMLGIKIATFGVYFADKNICESHGLDYDYISEWARYVCEICPDWDFVRLGQRDNAQACLDGLMTQSPDIILHKIDRLLKHSDWSTLSLDNSADWTTDQIRAFLKKIADTTKALDTLDLSDKQESLSPLSIEEIDLLTEFLNKVNVNSLDLSNQLLGPDKITRLFSSLIHSPKQINLNNNDLGTEGAVIVSEFIKRSTFPITHINVANNNIPDNELSYLLMQAQRHSISYIDFSNNFASQQTLDILAAGINNGSFQSINAANCDFSELDLTPVWQALSNSTVMQTLNLDNTGLIDSQFRKARDYFPYFSLTNLSLSNAELSKRGMNYLFSGLKENKSIKQLSLNGIRLTRAELTIIANELNQTALTTLSLDNCEISTEDFINWLQALPENCILEQLILSNNFLTDQGILALSHVMINEKLKLNYLDLSNTKITDVAGIQLASASKQVTTLILTDNLLNDDTAIALSKILAASRLKTLILGQNYIHAKGVSEIGTALPHSQLAILDLSSNPAGEGMRTIAENLVTEVAYLNQDDDKHLSIHAKRALYKAQPNTQLKEANFSNTTLSNGNAREMCRVLSRAGIDDVTLLPNPTVTAVDLKTCMTSSASILQPFSFFSVSSQVEVEYQYLDEEDYQAYLPQETEKDETSDISISEHERQLMIERYQFYSLMRDENIRPISENRLLFLPSSHTRGEPSSTSFAPLLLILPAAGITFLLLYLVYRTYLSIRTESPNKTTKETTQPQQRR